MLNSTLQVLIHNKDHLLYTGKHCFTSKGFYQKKLRHNDLDLWPTGPLNKRNQSFTKQGSLKAVCKKRLLSYTLGTVINVLVTVTSYIKADLPNIDNRLRKLKRCRKKKKLKILSGNIFKLNVFKLEHWPTSTKWRLKVVDKKKTLSRKVFDIQNEKVFIKGCWSSSW